MQTDIILATIVDLKYTTFTNRIYTSIITNVVETSHLLIFVNQMFIFSIIVKYQTINSLLMFKITQSRNYYPLYSLLEPI